MSTRSPDRIKIWVDEVLLIDQDFWAWWFWDVVLGFYGIPFNNATMVKVEFSNDRESEMWQTTGREA